MIFREDLKTKYLSKMKQIYGSSVELIQVKIKDKKIITDTQIPNVYCVKDIDGTWLIVARESTFETLEIGKVYILGCINKTIIGTW